MKSRAVVTGTSRGIGKAIAESLREAGFEVIGCSSKECDVSNEESVQKFFAKAGAAEVVVLNAGVLERGPVEAFTAAQFDRVIGVNLRGAFLCAREAFRQQAKRIIAIGSISGTLGTAESAAYNASKWGLTGLMKSLAEEGRAKGIFCATVLPSGVDTDMIKKTPFGPVMQPADLAKVVKFLCTEAPFAMTGSAVEVFG
jgi:3-oxoacyl-[acyl-carrier protein] reductase